MLNTEAAEKFDRSPKENGERKLFNNSYIKEATIDMEFIFIWILFAIVGAMIGAGKKQCSRWFFSRIISWTVRLDHYSLDQGG